ncbi:MAG: S41 family peptidase [Candidatus Dependentiae bacterium]|nr:S41 family peptidase [Candidatus Dependentiae bacterium]
MKAIKFYSLSLLGLIAILFVGYQFHTYNLKKSAQQDIDFMHQTILENHPGPHNDQDPDFVNNMNSAYLIAKNSINSIKVSNDNKNIIKQYLASFHDTHLRFHPKVQETVSTKTPDYKHFSIKEMPGNIVWITLPTFAPDKQQQKELEKIIDQISQHQTNKLIVFDVRSNTGGNSQWGTKILESLFGKEYVAQKLYVMNKNIEVDWRASKDNASYLASLIDYIKDQFGADSSQVSEFKTIEQGIQQAYKNHEKLYTERATKQEVSQTKSPSSVAAKIIVITSSRCVSSCLDFIDEIKAVDPKAILIGKTTGADSIYMEVRVIDLPSGIGKLQFPIKMYRNRLRGHNVPYTPNIAYPVSINSQEEKDQWLLQTIQKLSQGNT